MEHLFYGYIPTRHLRAGCLQACRLLRHANGEGNEDREIVLRARESGKVVLTAPFKLLNNRIGVILTYAAYKSELPSNATAQHRVVCCRLLGRHI